MNTYQLKMSMYITSKNYDVSFKNADVSLKIDDVFDVTTSFEPK